MHFCTESRALIHTKNTLQRNYTSTFQSNSAISRQKYEMQFLRQQVTMVCPTRLNELFLLTVPIDLSIYKTVLIIFPLNLQTITITLDVIKWRWGAQKRRLWHITFVTPHIDSLIDNVCINEVVNIHCWKTGNKTCHLKDNSNWQKQTWHRTTFATPQCVQKNAKDSGNIYVNWYLYYCH